jgi:ribosomal protein S18 acetylase RimI-like enzyme
VADQLTTYRPQVGQPSSSLVQASRYSFAELADIYSRARVDYIVPMPMNARRMEEYIRHYDVDLEASFVAINEVEAELGVGMLGLRGQRAWITRLGIVPEQRGHRVGQLLTSSLIEAARERAAGQVQLEVIEGNEPAHRLFLKLGFEAVRRLLVIRRPPGAVKDGLKFETDVLTPDEIRTCLDQRLPGASWIEETASLLNAGNLGGLRVTLLTGEQGWISFCQTPFQLSHFVVGTQDERIALALLQAVHQVYPLQDTKVENLPTDSPLWPAFQRVGYVETFRRIEMLMNL